jgi:hypothetical protein
LFSRLQLKFLSLVQAIVAFILIICFAYPALCFSLECESMGAVKALATTESFYLDDHTSLSEEILINFGSVSSTKKIIGEGHNVINQSIFCKA